MLLPRSTPLYSSAASAAASDEYNRHVSDGATTYDGDTKDVTGKDGYINVGRNGHAWGGKGKVTLPKAARKHIEWGKIVKGAFVVIITSFVMAGIAYLMSLVLSAPVLIFV